VIGVRNLDKHYTGGGERVHALAGIDFGVESHTFFTLLGPSGCGKSTLLRCVAGLEVPDSGEIRIGDRVVYASASGINLPPNHRRIGMVFQSYAIWPHMTVYQNVAFLLSSAPVRRAQAHAVRARARRTGRAG
jgi:iron(III) transport system ATP-binding protein